MGIIRYKLKGGNWTKILSFSVANVKLIQQKWEFQLSLHSSNDEQLRLRQHSMYG